MSTDAATLVRRSPAPVDAPLTSRLFARGLDLLPVLALTLTSLNSQGSLAFLASPTTKTLSTLLAAFGAVVLLVREEARPPAPPVIVLLGVIAAVLGMTSLIRDVPTQRYLLFGQYLILGFSLAVWICTRADRVLGILFTTGVVHLLLAKAFPTQVPWVNGLTRLSGGSHPIQLGFESSLVLVIAVIAVTAAHRLRSMLLFAAIALYAVVILLQAFARESLIAASVALVVLMMVIPGPFRWVRTFFAVVGFVAVILALGPDGIASLLGAEQVTDLSSATGRTDIWARVLTFLPDFLPLGYGYYALNDGIGPDRAVYSASNGAPAENALLQVLLDGGALGAAVWVLYLVVALTYVLRSRGSARAIGLASLPIFLATLLVSSGLSGTGIAWWYFLAIVAECSRTVRPRGRSLSERSSDSYSPA